MSKILDNIVNFVRVSPVQQVTALGLCTPFIALVTQNALENFSQGDTRAGLANTTLAAIYSGLFLANEYLGIRRMKEYSKLRKALEQHGWDERIIEPKSHSWCQRNMAQVASDDAGFGDQTKNYLSKKGYNRYNLLQN